MYLREIGTVPLLTWDGEKRLARAMEAGTYLQDVDPAATLEADGPPSVRAMYRELYLRLRAVYRFALADARVEMPTADGWDALRTLGAAGRHRRRAPARRGRSWPRRRSTRPSAAWSKPRSISHILPDEVLRWCADHDDDGELPEPGDLRARLS